tara:strand:- start:248 stop:559 length:312 start_codon:yes stop_codon:yes gene_type:complete
MYKSLFPIYNKYVNFSKLYRKFSEGDTVKIKKNIKNYISETGFVHSINRSEPTGLSEVVEKEILKYFLPKIWLAVGEGTFLFIEEKYLISAQILLTEKEETMS